MTYGPRLRHGAYLGGKESSTHAIWRGMIARCENTKNASYPRYGGRGIKVCERWQSFENFLADMGERPAGMSVDRADNDGDYEPGNCRWVGHSDQQKNKVSTRYYYDGAVVYTLSEAAATVGISRSLAFIRWKTWQTFEKGRIWHELQKQP